jgi:hypothetical protein
MWNCRGGRNALHIQGKTSGNGIHFGELLSEQRRKCTSACTFPEGTFDDWKPIIEPASPEECAMIEERAKEYETNPGSFVPWKKIRRGNRKGI